MGYQETVPVVGVLDYFAPIFVNPVGQVRTFCGSFPFLSSPFVALGQGLLSQLVSHLDLDNEIQ